MLEVCGGGAAGGVALLRVVAPFAAVVAGEAGGAEPGLDGWVGEVGGEEGGVEVPPPSRVLHCGLLWLRCWDLGDGLLEVLH